MLGVAVTAWSPMALARQIVVLPGVVNAVGVVSGVDATGPGTLSVGAQNINTSNDAGGAITTDAANTANIVFANSSTVTGFVGAIGTPFLNISAGTNANTVTFSGPVYATTFSVAGTGTVNFNGGFVSNTGSTLDFAGNGFINVASGKTVKAAITNSAGARTGTLTLNGNSILDGAVGAASGLKQINVVGGNALITGQVNAGIYNLDTNTLNVAGAFAIPVAGVINTTIFSPSLYGKIVPVGAATIGNALQVNVVVTGPIANGTSFNIVDATSGTNGSTVIATDNSTRYQFSASPTANGRVIITTTQIPLAVIVTPVVVPTVPGTTPVTPVVNPLVPIIIAPVIDALPVTPVTTPVLTAITLLPNATAVATALGQLAPGTASLAAPQIAFRATQRMQDALAAHFSCDRLIQEDSANRRAHRAESACPPNDMDGQFWGTLFGYFGQQDDVRGFEGNNSAIMGGTLAYDAPVGEATRIGGGIRYAGSTVDSTTGSSTAHVDSYQAMLYATYAPSAWFANVSLVYGIDRYTGARRVSFTGVDATPQAKFHGTQYTAFASTGYHFTLEDGATVVTPLATVQYTHLHTNAYTETGADSVALHINAKTYEFVQTGLGGKISYRVQLNDTDIIRPEIHGNWLHAFGSETMRATAAFAGGGGTFVTAGLKPSRETFNVGAGVNLANSSAWSVEGVYDYQWRSDSYVAHQAMIKLVVRM